tara:strand:- start:228 stop:842 length:615 start_codon:yes stop_codon:yes gene_type:complete
MAQRMRRRTTRRRAPTTRRSRITRRARKSAKKGFSIGKKIFPVAKNLASPIAFVEQISAKHRQTLGTAYTEAPIGQKLKILTNIVTGSTTGLNIFKDEYQAPLSQLKISNIFNKWTTAGAAMIGYGIIAKSANKALGSNIMPAISPVKSIGKQLVIGGALGGLFDDKVTSNSATRGTASIAPAMATMSYNGGYSSGSDSTESSL